jgi:hypothetical protein
VGRKDMVEDAADDHSVAEVMKVMVTEVPVVMITEVLVIQLAKFVGVPPIMNMTVENSSKWQHVCYFSLVNQLV